MEIYVVGFTAIPSTIDRNISLEIVTLPALVAEWLTHSAAMCSKA